MVFKDADDHDEGDDNDDVSSEAFSYRCMIYSRNAQYVFIQPHGKGWKHDSFHIPGMGRHSNATRF